MCNGSQKRLGKIRSTEWLNDTMGLHRYQNGCVGNNTPTRFFKNSNELTFFPFPPFLIFCSVSFTSFLAAFPFFPPSWLPYDFYIPLLYFHPVLIPQLFILQFPNFISFPHSLSLSLSHCAIGVPKSIQRVDQALSTLWCGQTQQKFFCMLATINPIHKRNNEYISYTYITLSV